VTTLLNRLIGVGLGMLVGLLVCLPSTAEEQYLRLSTRVALDIENSDLGVIVLQQNSLPHYQAWAADMSDRLLKIIPQASILRNKQLRTEFLSTVYYESARAGLDPQWVLAIIEVESAFRKFAISNAGAHGFMQVMPFWVDLIGEQNHSLFHLRTNLRYGTVILRHYLDIEDGDLFRALGRYNGSLGRAEYPDLVLRALSKNWYRS